MDELGKSMSGERSNELIRRRALLNQKYPEIYSDKTPESIKKEYEALSSLIDSLETSRREILGLTKSSDGYVVDGFVAEKYENALENFNKYSEMNKEYITLEEEEKFEFSKVDFEGLIEKINNMKDAQDSRNVLNELIEVSKNQPKDVQSEINELKKMWTDKSKDLPERKTEETIENKKSKENKKDENKNQNSEKGMLDLIKELAKVQAESAMLSAKIFARQGREKISEKVSEMGNTISEQAKKYGNKAQKLADTYKSNKDKKGNIISDYKASLEAIQETYANDRNDYADLKAEYEDSERGYILKFFELRNKRKEIKKSPEYAKQVKDEQNLTKEIQKALKKGDLDTVAIKNDELKKLMEENSLLKCEKEIEETNNNIKSIRESIETCKEEIKNCRLARNESIKVASENKDNKLSVMEKQNIFQKIAGSVFNKINGTKKFKENVISKATQKVEYIKNEKLPEIKSTISEKRESFKNHVVETKQGVLNKGKELKLQMTQKIEKSIEEGKGNIEEKKNDLGIEK